MFGDKDGMDFIRSCGTDAYVEMIQVENGILYIVYTGIPLSPYSIISARNYAYARSTRPLVGKKEIMGVSCCAFGCTNRHRQREGLRFFRFPNKPVERRRKWITSVKRKDWQPSKHTRICGDHFVSGLSK